jgi:hypothetical protein
VRAYVPIPGKSVVARHLFTELRFASRGNLMVTQHLVATLVTLRDEIRDPGTRSVVAEALVNTVEDSEEALSPKDYARVRAVAARSDTIDDAV